MAETGLTMAVRATAAILLLGMLMLADPNLCQAGNGHGRAAARQPSRDLPLLASRDETDQQKSKHAQSKSQPQRGQQDERRSRSDQRRTRSDDRNRGRDAAPGDQPGVQHGREQFKSLKPDEQQRLRETEQRYRQLSPQQREQLRERWEHMSADERARYRRQLERKRDSD